MTCDTEWWGKKGEEIRMRNNKESAESDDGRLSNWKADSVPLSCEEQTPSSSADFLRLHTHLTNMLTIPSMRLLLCKVVSFCTSCFWGDQNEVHS